MSSMEPGQGLGIPWKLNLDKFALQALLRETIHSITSALIGNLISQQSFTSFFKSTVSVICRIQPASQPVPAQRIRWVPPCNGQGSLTSVQHFSLPRYGMLL